MVKIINKETVSAFVMALSLFLFFPPYFVWGIDLLYIIFPSIYLVILLNLDFKRSLNETMAKFLLWFLYVIVAIRYNGGALGRVNVLFMPLLLFVKFDFYVLVYRYFRCIFLFFIVPSFIVYIFTFFINISYEEIAPLNISKETIYLKFPFLIKESIWGVTSPRFFGFLDEPGYTATIIAILLWIDGFDLKNKANLFLFICGICTMSLFFNVVVLVYFVFVVKKLKYKVLFFLLVVFSVYLFKDNMIVQQLVFDRLEIKNGQLAGENRNVDAFILVYDEFKDDVSYFVGMGDGEALKINRGGASYKNIIYDYGIIFFVFYFLSFAAICFSMSKNLYKTIVFVCFLGMIIYQRPSILNITYFFLFVAMVYNLKSNGYGYGIK